MLYSQLYNEWCASQGAEAVAHVAFVSESDGDGVTVRVGGSELTVVIGEEGQKPIVLGDLGERANEVLERLENPNFSDVLSALLRLSMRVTTPLVAKRRRSEQQQPEEDEDEEDEDEDAAEDEGEGAAADEDESDEDEMEHEDEDEDELAAEVEHETPPTRAVAGGDGPGAAEAFRRLQSSTGGRAISLSRRLQSDLLEIVKGDSEHRGFEVELADESRLDTWRVRYMRFPPDSQLARDLETLRRTCSAGETPCVEIECRFGADYPFSPPSIRVVRPCFCSGTGYVIDGAICMELLTPSGWNATFSIEAILEQVRAHLVFGKGRLDLPDALRSEEDEDEAQAGASKRAAAQKALSSSYSAERSRASMTQITKYHDEKGWASAGKS